MPTDLCLPWWHRLGAIKGHVNSGCVTSNGNVQCDPEQMRADAEAALKKAGYLAAGDSLTLAEYTLARNMTSEDGSSSPETRVAVGEAAVNRARLEGLPDVNALLLYRQPEGNLHRGYYGPINVTPKTGRWAATSNDPQIADVLLARLILSGQTNNFNQGADDQDGLDEAKYFPDPVATIKRKAQSRDYWVGPVPGVDYWATTQWRHMADVDPNGAQGQQLIARGVAAFSDRRRPNWTELPPCGGGPSSGDGPTPGIVPGSLHPVAAAGLVFVGVVSLGLLLLGRRLRIDRATE